MLVEAARTLERIGDKKRLQDCYTLMKAMGTSISTWLYEHVCIDEGIRNIDQEILNINVAACKNFIPLIRYLFRYYFVNVASFKKK